MRELDWLTNSKKSWFKDNKELIEEANSLGIVFLPISGGGGGDTDEPPAPSPKETTREALESELEFKPRFAAQELELLQKFGIDTARAEADIQEEIGGRLARFERALQEELFPEEVATGRALGQRLAREVGETGLPKDLESFAEERFRSEEASAGRLGGPAGSINIARKFADLSESTRAQRVSEALSFSGRVPVLGSSQVQIGQPGQDFGRFVSASLGAASSIFGTQANIFGTNVGAKTARRGQNLKLAGTVAGAALCWVAKTIFGSWEHPKTIMARFYISELGPKWFKNFYLTYGERIAKYIEDKPIIKLLLRPAFEFFAFRGSCKTMEAYNG